MKSPTLRTTIREELFSFSSVTIIVVIGCMYILLSTLLLNYKLFVDTITDGFPLTAQLTIFLALLQGIWATMHIWDNMLLVINAILVGVNILLIGKTVYLLEHMGKINLSIGGATVISLVTTGCASCGLSILSLLGFSASLSILPFHGAEIHALSTVILLFSSLYMLKQIYNAKYCKVK